MQTYVILWAAILVFAIVAELGTAALVSVWFMPGALAALILAICKVDLWIQIVAFFALSGICLFVGFKFFRHKMMKNPAVRVNADGLVGKEGVVTESIDNLAETGSVKINHQIWSARTKNGEKIPAGAVVVVEEISGVKLICRKSETK
ncbi:MAG: NfeD family protein [Clostridia bacterium]|nr:NfeD family protein [Clostridia bacterium]